MKRILIVVAVVATVKMMCCKTTYDQINKQLTEGKITVEQAQKLWLEHKKSE